MYDLYSNKPHIYVEFDSNKSDIYAKFDFNLCINYSVWLWLYVTGKFEKDLLLI